MSWIKIRTDLRDDVAVDRLADLLNEDDVTVIGRLVLFWTWIDKQAVGGRVPGATDRHIDRRAGKAGFASALQAVGWLALDDAGASIPNFDRHNGESAKERSLKNVRQAKWREGRRLESDSNVDGGASTDSSTSPPTLSSTDSSTSPSTDPATSPSTAASTREDKSREDKRREEAGMRARHGRKQKTPLPPEFAISEQVKAWAGKKGFTRLPEHLEAFRLKASANQYVYADWDAAFMTAIRQDWAQLQKQKSGNGRACDDDRPIR